MDPTEILPDAPAAAAPPTPPVPGVPAPAAPPASAGAPPVEPPREGVLRALWRRVTTTTPHKPEEYTGRRLPRTLNAIVDGRGVRGAAHEVLLGESVGLFVDHALAGGRGGAQTPLGHLMGASGEYVWRVWDTAPAAPNQPTDPNAAAAEPREE